MAEENFNPTHTYPPLPNVTLSPDQEAYVNRKMAELLAMAEAKMREDMKREYEVLAAQMAAANINDRYVHV